jgi:hypothetical protein
MTGIFNYLDIYRYCILHVKKVRAKCLLTQFYTARNRETINQNGAKASEEFGN